MTRILLVEDDAAIRTSLSDGSTERVPWCRRRDGGGRDPGLAVERPDAVVLDLGLPDLDGSDVLAMVRPTSAVPVVIATARDDEREIVRLLDAGADDYLVKPFRRPRSMARVRAVLRRRPGRRRPTAGSWSAAS